MTLQEVAQQLGKSESTIYKNFKRTQQTLMKKGIILTRWGKDDYEIEYEDYEDKEPYLTKLARERQEQRKLKEEGK